MGLKKVQSVSLYIHASDQDTRRQMAKWVRMLHQIRQDWTVGMRAAPWVVLKLKVHLAGAF